MTSQDLNQKTEPPLNARATLYFSAPWQSEDKIVHSGSYDECKRLLLSKRRVVQDNSFIVVGDDRYSSADIVKFGNESDQFPDSA